MKHLRIVFGKKLLCESAYNESGVFGIQETETPTILFRSLIRSELYLSYLVYNLQNIEMIIVVQKF